MEILWFFLIMEDIFLVRGEIILDHVCVSDKNMIKELEQKDMEKLKRKFYFSNSLKLSICCILND